MAVMSTTKDNWNRNHYTQIKVSVRPEVAAAFKLSCAVAGTSMASEIGSFMALRAGTGNTASDSLPSVQVRKQRRAEVDYLSSRLRRVLEAEESYRDNIPENLRGSSAYDTAENIIDMLDEVLSALEEIYQ
jgi:hypothetical protein